MSQIIRITLPFTVVKVSGTVNSITATWMKQNNEWVTLVDTSEDGKYFVNIIAVDEIGNTQNYTFLLYYGLSLITDRTSEDVDRAIYLINQWNNRLITSEEITEYFNGLKGVYTTADLNRVGSALKYINDRLTECGYNITVESRSDWQMNEYFTSSNFSVYLSDIEEIRSALATLSTTPKTPTLDKFDYNKANDIEKILLDVDFLITKTMDNWIYSGEVASGEV